MQNCSCLLGPTGSDLVCCRLLTWHTGAGPSATTAHVSATDNQAAGAAASAARDATVNAAADTAVNAAADTAVNAALDAAPDAAAGAALDAAANAAPEQDSVTTISVEGDADSTVTATSPRSDVATGAALQWERVEAAVSDAAPAGDEAARTESQPADAIAEAEASASDLTATGSHVDNTAAGSTKEHMPASSQDVLALDTNAALDEHTASDAAAVQTAGTAEEPNSLESHAQHSASDIAEQLSRARGVSVGMPDQAIVSGQAQMPDQAMASEQASRPELGSASGPRGTVGFSPTDEAAEGTSGLDLTFEQAFAALQFATGEHPMLVWCCTISPCMY